MICCISSYDLTAFSVGEIVSSLAFLEDIEVRLAHGDLRLALEALFKLKGKLIRINCFKRWRIFEIIRNVMAKGGGERIKVKN